MPASSISRRGLLRGAGGVATGFALGGLDAGSVTARPDPGEVLTFGELYQRRVPFTVGPVITDDADYPRCRAANSPTQPLDGIAIVYDDGSASAIAVPGDQFVEPGSRYEFAAAAPVDCEYDAGLTVVRTAMKPVG